MQNRGTIVIKLISLSNKILVIVSHEMPASGRTKMWAIGMEKNMNAKTSFESPLDLSISNYPHNSHSVAANTDKSDWILKQEY